MPRDNNGLYYHPVNTEAVSGEPATASQFNATRDAIKDDLNTPRPIKFGGTGATTAAAALTALGAQADVRDITWLEVRRRIDGDGTAALAFYSSNDKATPNATILSRLGPGGSLEIIQRTSGDIRIDGGNRLLRNGKAIYDASNIVGPVSVDGSLSPTGAVMQLLNQNSSQFTARYANGVQNVYGKTSLATGNTVTITFDYPFSSTTLGPFVTLALGNIGNTQVFASVNSVNRTALIIRLYTPGTALTTDVHWSASGMWM